LRWSPSQPAAEPEPEPVASEPEPLPAHDAFASDPDAYTADPEPYADHEADEPGSLTAVLPVVPGAAADADDDPAYEDVPGETYDDADDPDHVLDHTLVLPAGAVATGAAAAAAAGGVAHPRPPRRHLHLPGAAGEHGLLYRYVLPGAFVAAALLGALGVAGFFEGEDRQPARAVSTAVPAPPAGAPPVVPETDTDAAEQAALAAERRARRARRERAERAERAAAARRRREREAAATTSTTSTAPVPAGTVPAPAAPTPRADPEPEPRRRTQTTPAGGREAARGGELLGPAADRDDAAAGRPRRLRADPRAHALTPLQDIVDELAARAGRAIDVEDRRFRLLAHSAHDGPVDDVRRDTILRRAASPAVVERLERLGIAGARGPLRLPPAPELGMGARVCFPVHDGASCSATHGSSTSRRSRTRTSSGSRPRSARSPRRSPRCATRRTSGAAASSTRSPRSWRAATRSPPPRCCARAAPCSWRSPRAARTSARCAATRARQARSPAATRAARSRSSWATFPR
jgi:hypothetical protein